MSCPEFSLESQPLDPERIVSSVISNQEAVREIIVQSAQQPAAKRLHRLASTRKEQGVSLTRAAKRLSLDIAEARRQEAETTDLFLSQLYAWREVLQIPVCELVVEPDDIPNNPIRSRSQLIKMMKTAKTIAEAAKEESIRILARLLIDQLVELMPELKSVSAWPTVGQAREQRDPGQAALRRFDSFISRRLEE